jgi:hypothetical protein
MGIKDLHFHDLRHETGSRVVDSEPVEERQPSCNDVAPSEKQVTVN